MADKKGKNKFQMQLANRSTLLKLLNQYQDICRKDLAEMSGLTGAAVTNIIKDLINVNLLSEHRNYDSSRNGNTISLRINYQSFYVIGVTFKRGIVSYGVSDLSGKYLEKHNIEIKLEETVNNVLQTLSAAVDSCIEKYNSRGKIVGLGLAVPGPFNSQKGEISHLSNLPGWETVPVKQYFQNQFDFPVILDENANATAFAERWFGCAQNYNNMISILVSKGVGAGIIINGEIYHGDFGFAGEIGHTSINFDGPYCDCGNKGCLELYCSTLTLLKKAREVCSNNQLTKIKSLKQYLENGDKNIKKLVVENGKYLGYSLINLINLFNPELIVIHSEINNLGNLWLDSIKEVISKRLNLDILANIQISYTALEDDSILLGASAMVCDYVFNNPQISYFKS